MYMYKLTIARSIYDTETVNYKKYSIQHACNLHIQMAWTGMVFPRFGINWWSE